VFALLLVVSKILVGNKRYRSLRPKNIYFLTLIDCEIRHNSDIDIVYVVGADVSAS